MIIGNQRKGLNEKMKLKEFIENYINRNSLIRLWRNNDEDKCREMLTQDAVMEWEILELSDKITFCEVLYVTDIYCEKCPEAINIVLKTDLTRDDITKELQELRKLRDGERYNCSDDWVRIRIRNISLHIDEFYGCENTFSSLSYSQVLYLKNAFILANNSFYKRGDANDLMVEKITSELKWLDAYMREHAITTISF